jgi:hypothetical protein
MRKVIHSCTQGLLVLSFLATLTGCGQTPAPSAAVREEPRPTREPDRFARVAAERYDLERDEQRGGHTLKKHVGRTDEQLRERLAEEANISAASTWTDREIAETTVAEALHREHGRIENWMRRGYPRANLALHYNAGGVIGRSLRRDDTQTAECTSAVIVLRAGGPDSFFVLTTYPETRE